MSVSMIGIDFNKASDDIRSKFSFTKKNAVISMERLKEVKGILGCVILSTCNRMEIWVSKKDNADINLYKFLCNEKKIDSKEYIDVFDKREGKCAVKHLFYLTSGLKSQILAEDQILTQVKDALSLSRESFCTDNVIEVLFRKAITAAKKVKTDVVFSRANTSVIYNAVEYFYDKGYSFKDKKCMVIGNGNMGKLTALALTGEGADVTVTVRQYKSVIVEIPEGCKRINYGDRLSIIPEFDVVVSATSSPNCTITKESLEKINIKKELILLDLAVPRDIESDVSKIENVHLYDIDSFKVDKITPETQKSLDKAGIIIDEQMDEFFEWYTGKELIPEIYKIKKEMVTDVELRIEKNIRKLDIEEEDKEKLVDTINNAAGKVILKMMFGLKEILDKDVFAECVEGIKNIY